MVHLQFEFTFPFHAARTFARIWQMASTNPNTFVLARQVGINVPGRLKLCAQILQLDVDSDGENKKKRQQIKTNHFLFAGNFYDLLA
jgi:hypothetical protein